MAAYENPYLENFAPIFSAILKEKEINPAKMELIIFDEEADRRNEFARISVLDVLVQLCENINALTIYTDRPDFFYEFVERSWEELGLLVMLMAKKEQNKAGALQFGCTQGIILDFERHGICYGVGKYSNLSYIPIHKKSWEISENLDIKVPFGYNVVIVKGKDTNDKRFVRDRFEEGFYRDE